MAPSLRELSGKAGLRERQGTDHAARPMWYRAGLRAACMPTLQDRRSLGAGADVPIGPGAAPAHPHPSFAPQMPPSPWEGEGQRTTPMKTFPPLGGRCPEGADEGKRASGKAGWPHVRTLIRPAFGRPPSPFQKEGDLGASEKSCPATKWLSSARPESAKRRLSGSWERTDAVCVQAAAAAPWTVQAQAATRRENRRSPTTSAVAHSLSARLTTRASL